MIAVPSAGLRRLMILESRGYVRGIYRRLKTPKGALFALLGAGLLTVWVRSLFLRSDSMDSLGVSGPMAGLGEAGGDDFFLRGLGLGVLALVCISGIVTRGIHIPPDRLERLLTLPVSRSDFLRYRLWCLVARTMTGAPVLAVLAMSRGGHSKGTLLAVPLFLAVSSILGFFCALLSATLEGSGPLVRITTGLRSSGRFLLLILVLGIPVGALANSAPEVLPAWLSQSVSGFSGFLEQVDFRGIVNTLSRPIEPFIRLSHADSLGAFSLYGGICTAMLVLSLELVSRVAVDFREMAMEGAQVTAKRIRNASRVGRAASSGRARLGLFAVPHFLGRGPLGAVAWRKLAGIWRKARGFLGISFLLGGFLLFGVRILFGGDLFGGGYAGQDAEDVTYFNDIGSAVLALLGTLYLTNGLRFDFREDLEHMDILRSWPLAPWKLFLASLLPQVLAISLVVSLLLLVWLSISQATGLLVLLLVVALPIFVYAWVAVDNIAFLFWPVRFVPGQSGQLQHIGRGLLLTFARMTLFLLAFGLALGVGALAWFGLSRIEDLSPDTLFTLVGLAGLVVLVAVDFGLTLLGGLAFAKFDPARDRV